MEKYISELLANGFCQAKVNPYRFYKMTGEFIAFYVNLEIEGGYPKIFYGYSLIWRSEDSMKNYIEEGEYGAFCKIRGAAELFCREDEEDAREAISAFYEKYKDVPRKEIQYEADARNRKFVGVITKVLRPCGFKKIDSRWRCELNGRLTLWFQLKKVMHTDKYYFNVIVSPKDDFNRQLYFESIWYHGNDAMDWQLVRLEEAERFFRFVAENNLMPIIRKRQ